MFVDLTTSMPTFANNKATQPKMRLRPLFGRARPDKETTEHQGLFFGDVSCPLPEVLTLSQTKSVISANLYKPLITTPPTIL